MTTADTTLWQRLYHTRLRDAIRGRFDASLDWRIVIADAGLPADVSKLIRKVVHATKLRRDEKVSVASELVAHFQDGLEAGQSPEELVRSFGDPSQTAILIRRAKKRNRSLIWHVWRYGCWAISAIAIAYIATGLWMFLDRPTIKTDFLAILNERATAAPENERAWPLYREALLALGAEDTYETTSPFSVASLAKPGGSDWPAAEKYLNDHVAAIAKLREAAGRRALGLEVHTSPAAFSAEDRNLFGWNVTPEQEEAAKNQTVTDRWVISALIPHINLLNSAARLLANDTRRAAAQGDDETAASNIRAIYGMARHCEELPFLVSLLVAEHAQQQARFAIQDVLRDHPDVWKDDTLLDLAHLTAGTQIDWRRGFEGERASFYDSMQRVYTDDGNGDGRLALHVEPNTTSRANFFELLTSVTSGLTDNQQSKTPLSNSVLAMLAMPATNMVVASRREMTDMYDRLADRALQHLETPLWETAEGSSVDDEVNSWRSQLLGNARYLFVSLLLPAFDSVRHAYASSEGQREGLMIGLALELYHRKNGTWPESLAELTPRWLPELPVDRITGKPLLYRIVDDRPIVFSAGVDGDNDGGRPPAYVNDDVPYAVGPLQNLPPDTPDTIKNHDDGDWVLWSTQK